MVVKKKSENQILVKRRGHLEEYKEKKVYASCYFACKSVNVPERNCEKNAEKVAKAVTKWVKGLKKPITSDMIFERIASELRKHDEDAAFMYATHREVN